MSSALQAGLFAILGMGLAGTSAACGVLWQRVRAWNRAVGDTSARGAPGSTGRLDELLGQVRALEARLAKVEASATMTPPPTFAIPTASHPIGPRPARRFDRGSPATSGGPTLISVPDLAAPPSSTSEAAAELDRRFGPVWAMADQGTPVDAIARESGYPIGQVELILGLRRRLLVAEAGPDA